VLTGTGTGTETVAPNLLNVSELAFGLNAAADVLEQKH
jgi:hypothetical protein